MSDEKRTYEAMFLLDGSNSEFEAAARPIRAVLDRNEAEVLALKPWDERRLAYEIKGRRRGLYALAYFNADPERIKEIEHDCQLSEEILRALIIHKEHLSEEDLAAETPATAAAKRSTETPSPKREPEQKEPQLKDVETDKDDEDEPDDSDVAEPEPEDIESAEQIEEEQ